MCSSQAQLQLAIITADALLAAAMMSRLSPRDNCVGGDDRQAKQLYLGDELKSNG